MKNLYPDVKDEELLQLLYPKGNKVNINIFFDSDHTVNWMIRWTHTGIILYIYMAPAVLYSKRQNTIDSSTFGSELISLWTAFDMIEKIICKLRLMRVSVEGLASVFCDN